MTKNEALSSLWGLIVAAAALFIFYLFIAALLDKFNSIGSDLAKAMVAALIGAPVAAFAIVLGKIWELKIKIRQEIRDKKIPLYEKQIGLFFQVFFAEKLGKPRLEDKEMLAVFADFSEKLMIWGDPEVIKAWERFRVVSAEPKSPEQTMMVFEEFVLVLRKDVGNSNNSLRRGDILRIFVNDFKFD